MSNDTTRPGTGATRWAIGVIDVENDFCEGGSLAVEGGAAVAGRIRQWIDSEPDRWVARFATADRHPVELPGHFAPPGEDPNFVDTWPPHCVVGTPGADLHPELLGDSGVTDLFDVLVEKGQRTAAYSGFEGTTPDGSTLERWLRSRAVDGVELVGIATDHCVRATALDAVRSGFHVRVLTDLCVGITPESVAASMKEMSDAGVEVVTTTDLPRIANR